MKNGRGILVFIAALTIIAITALVIAVVLDNSQVRTGSIAVATSCVAVLATLARKLGSSE